MLHGVRWSLVSTLRGNISVPSARSKRSKKLFLQSEELTHCYRGLSRLIIHCSVCKSTKVSAKVLFCGWTGMFCRESVPVTIFRSSVLLVFETGILLSWSKNQTWRSISNLELYFGGFGPGTGRRDSFCMVFSVPLGICQKSTLPLPSALFHIHYLLIILTLDDILFDMLTLLNVLQINK